MAQSPRVYAVVRSVVSFALRCFYRIIRAGPSLPQGPLLLVGNHPNALIDPGLMIAVSARPLTFLPLKLFPHAIPCFPWTGYGPSPTNT